MNGSTNVEMRRLTLDGNDRTAGELLNVAGDGVLFDNVPTNAVSVSFDNDPRRLPVSPGRKYNRAFSSMTFYHGAGFQGDVFFLIYGECAEPFNEAAPVVVVPAPLVDVVQAPGAWSGLVTNVRMHPVGGGATNTADYALSIVTGTAIVAAYAFGRRWNSITQGSIGLTGRVTLPMLAGKWFGAPTYDISATICAQLAGGAFRPLLSDLAFGIVQGNGGVPGVQSQGDSPGVEFGMADNTGAAAVFWREMGAPYGDGSTGRTLIPGVNLLTAPAHVRWRVKPATVTADAQVELYVDGLLRWSRKLPPDYGVVRSYTPQFISSVDQGNALLFADLRYTATVLG